MTFREHLVVLLGPLEFPGGHERQDAHLLLRVWAPGAYLWLLNAGVRLGNSASKTKATGQRPRVFKVPGTEAGDVHADMPRVKQDQARASQSEASVARSHPRAPRSHLFLRASAQGTVVTNFGPFTSEDDTSYVSKSSDVGQGCILSSCSSYFLALCFVLLT